MPVRSWVRLRSRPSGRALEGRSGWVGRPARDRVRLGFFCEGGMGGLFVGNKYGRPP